MDGSAMDSKAVAQNGSGTTGTDDGEDSQKPVIYNDCFNKDPAQDNDSTEMELCMKIRYRDALRQYPHKVNDITESFPFQLPPPTGIDVRDQVFHVVCQAWKQGDGTQFKKVYEMLLWFCNESSSDKKNGPSGSSVLGILLGHMVPVDARTGRVQLTQSQINLLCHDGIVALGKDDITLHKQKAIEENHPTKIVFIMFEKRMKELRQHQPTDSWMLPMKSSSITQHLLAALISTRLLPFFTFQELFPILLTIYGMTLVEPGSYFDELHQHALLKRTAFGAYREHCDLRGELDAETDRYLLCSVRRVMQALWYQPSNNNKPRANTGTNSCSLGAANNSMGSTDSSLGQPGNHSGQTLRPTTNSDTSNRSTEPTDNLLETKRSSSRNQDNDESESSTNLDRAPLVYYCPWDHHLQIEHMVQTAAKPEKVAAEMERFIKYQCEGTLKSLHFPQVNGIKNSKQSQPSEIRENLLRTVFHSMKQGDGKALPKAYYDIFEWSCQLSSINNASSKSSILAYLLASMVLVDSETGRVQLTQSQINQLFQACNDNNNEAVAMEVGNPKEAAGETNSTTTSSLSESSKASSSLCMSDGDGNNNEAVAMEVGNPKEAARETNSITTNSLSESSKASSSLCMSDGNGNNNEAVAMEVGNPKEAARETNSITTNSLSESRKTSSTGAEQNSGHDICSSLNQDDATASRDNCNQTSKPNNHNNTITDSPKASGDMDDTTLGDSKDICGSKSSGSPHATTNRSNSKSGNDNPTKKVPKYKVIASVVSPKEGSGEANSTTFSSLCMSDSDGSNHGYMECNNDDTMKAMVENSKGNNIVSTLGHSNKDGTGNQTETHMDATSTASSSSHQAYTKDSRDSINTDTMPISISGSKSNSTDSNTKHNSQTNLRTAATVITPNQGGRPQSTNTDSNPRAHDRSSCRDCSPNSSKDNQTTTTASPHAPQGTIQDHESNKACLTTGPTCNDTDTNTNDTATAYISSKDDCQSDKLTTTEGANQDYDGNKACIASNETAKVNGSGSTDSLKGPTNNLLTPSGSTCAGESNIDHNLCKDNHTASNSCPHTTTTEGANQDYDGHKACIASNETAKVNGSDSTGSLKGSTNNMSTPSVSTCTGESNIDHSLCKDNHTASNSSPHTTTTEVANQDYDGNKACIASNETANDNGSGSTDSLKDPTNSMSTPSGSTCAGESIIDHSPEELDVTTTAVANQHNKGGTLTSITSTGSHAHAHTHQSAIGKKRKPGQSAGNCSKKAKKAKKPKEKQRNKENCGVTVIEGRYKRIFRKKRSWGRLVVRPGFKFTNVPTKKASCGGRVTVVKKSRFRGKTNVNWPRLRTSWVGQPRKVLRRTKQCKGAGIGGSQEKEKDAGKGSERKKKRAKGRQQTKAENRKEKGTEKKMKKKRASGRSDLQKQSQEEQAAEHPRLCI